jgi:probable phosphoglycerate mutase
LTSKKIYLIRHGQTEFNRLGIVQGSGVDASLNDTGRQQAELFWKRYQDYPFDVVYTSALKRSIESVQSFIDRGVPHRSRPQLNEISWGEMDGKAATGSDKNQYWDLIDQWKKGNINYSLWGGESPALVQQRQLDVIQEWKTGEEKAVLVCMHGRAIRILLSTLLQTPLQAMDQYEHSNLCLYVLELKDGKFRLEIANDVAHMRSSV